MKGGSWFSIGARVGMAGLALLAIAAEAGADAIRHSITYSTVAHFGPLGTPFNLRGVGFKGVEYRTIEVADPIPKDSLPAALFSGSATDLPLGKLFVELPSEGVRAGGDMFQLTVGVHAIDGV